jgi:hypothetical protein
MMRHRTPKLAAPQAATKTDAIRRKTAQTHFGQDGVRHEYDRYADTSTRTGAEQTCARGQIQTASNAAAIAAPTVSAPKGEKRTRRGAFNGSRIAAGSSAAHTALVREVLAAVGSLPGVVAGANASGRAAYVDERTGRVARVPYGWPSAGGPDLLIVVAPLGRLVAFECKTGNAQLTAKQRAVHAALRAVGVHVAIVRSVDDARQSLAQLNSDNSR